MNAEIEQMPFVFDEGGKSIDGRYAISRDCVTRAVAIASGRPYLEVYERLDNGMGDQRLSKNHTANHRRRGSSRGVTVQRKWFKDYMRELGFIWVPTMSWLRVQGPSPQRRAADGALGGECQ